MGRCRIFFFDGTMRGHPPAASMEGLSCGNLEGCGETLGYKPCMVCGCPETFTFQVMAILLPHYPEKNHPSSLVKSPKSSIEENPSINGWFWDTLILGNLHMLQITPERTSPCSPHPHPFFHPVLWSRQEQRNLEVYRDFLTRNGLDQIAATWSFFTYFLW